MLCIRNPKKAFLGFFCLCPGLTFARLPGLKGYFLPGRPTCRTGFFYCRMTILEGIMENYAHDDKSQRVVTFLNRDEVDFLDKLGKDALFTSGSKLSRAKLIAWLVDFLKGLNVTGDNLRSEEDLEHRVMEALHKIEDQKDATSHGA
jgi:hypothetical protein